MHPGYTPLEEDKKNSSEIGNTGCAAESKGWGGEHTFLPASTDKSINEAAVTCVENAPTLKETKGAKSIE